MIITKHPFTGPLQPILFAGNFIKVVEQSDCLGIKIDNRLCWKSHITASCKKFCSKLKFIKRITGLPAKVLEEIYYKGIIPSITYCISVWGTCSPSLINSLEDVHICAGRIIHKLKPSVKDNEVLSKIGWSALQYIYKRRLATIMHEVYHNKVHRKSGFMHHNKLHRKLGSPFEKEAKQRTLRNKNNFRPINPKYETSRNCVRYRGPIIWNKLPNDLKEVESSEAFKRQLKKAKPTLDKIQFEKEAMIDNKDLDFILFRF